MNRFNFISMLVLCVGLFNDAVVKKQWVANLAQDSRDLNILVEFPGLETKEDEYRLYVPPGETIREICQKL